MVSVNIKVGSNAHDKSSHVQHSTLNLASYPAPKRLVSHDTTRLVSTSSIIIPSAMTGTTRKLSHYEVEQRKVSHNGASHFDTLFQHSTTNAGMHVADGVTGLRQVSHTGPVLGHQSRRVEIVDGTSPRHAAKLCDASFNVRVASRSDSVSDIAFPEGAVEIEQHYYKGNVIEEAYGEVNQADYRDTVIREIPVYKKEVEEVIKRERVVNTIVERVPVFNYIDNIVEVEHIIEKPVYKEVPVKKTVVRQVPKQIKEQRLIEKVRYVPVTEEVEVERIIEIPGEVIVQPRRVVRDEHIVTDKHLDKEVPVVISQVVQPIMKDTKKKVRVAAKVLSPDLSTTAVVVPKPVDLEFHQSDATTKYKWCYLSNEDYNSAFFQLNSHLSADHRKALKADHHVKINPTTGYPVIREKNLKFYRLSDKDLPNIEGWNVHKRTSSSSTSSTSSYSYSSSDMKSRATSKKSSVKSSKSHSKMTSHRGSVAHTAAYVHPGSKYVSVAKSSDTHNIRAVRTTEPMVHHVAPVVTSTGRPVRNSLGHVYNAPAVHNTSHTAGHHVSRETQKLPTVHVAAH